MTPSNHTVDRAVLAAMGGKYSGAHEQDAGRFRTRLAANSTDIGALLGLANTNILQYVFAYCSREETLPGARTAAHMAWEMQPSNADVLSLTGTLSLLDWDWEGAEVAFREAIERDPDNLGARHWYSLLLVAMGRYLEAMAQSDEIMRRDPNEDYLVGRGSLYWFQHRFEELKELMHRCIAKNPSVPWGYDWLGMAYNALREHDDAIRTYAKAFELSDGTAEVGAGYAHALAEAGETDLAREMADFYAAVAEERYVPPVQRAYIHIGLREYDEAIRLLEEAFEQRSWFLEFMKVEPWLDPLRSDPRFAEIERRMRFPG